MILNRCLTSLALFFFLFACACGPGGSSSKKDTGEPGDVAQDSSPADTLSDAGGTDSSPTDEGGVDGSQEDPGGTDGGADVVPDISGEGEPNGEACPTEKRVGYFEVAHWGFYAAVAGHVTDGVIPLEVLQAKEIDGDCRLMRKENPFCDPPCGAGQLCNHDGTCLQYPENKSVGTVTVEGLLEAVVMEPSITNAYAETDVNMPFFENNAKVSLIAQGADVEGFTLYGYGVEDLVVAASILTLIKGEDLNVTWTASEGKGNIHMRLNVDQHGNSPVTMVCDLPDTGSALLPGVLLKILLEYGVSGFATFDIYRRTVDSVWLGDSCVELRTLSFSPGKVLVEGHVPCFGDNDCPEGETCKVAINTCVGE